MLRRAVEDSNCLRPCDQETDSSHRSRLSSNGQCIFSPMADGICAMNEPDPWYTHGSPAKQVT
jgi:hypothetical protein